MFRFDLDKKWLEFINQNLKWCVGIILRSFTITGIVFSCFYVLWIVSKDIRMHSSDQVVTTNVRTVELRNESKESKITYEGDMKKLAEILKKLENARGLK